MIIISLILLQGCSQISHIDKNPLVEKILNENDSYFYLDTSEYPANDPALPVGIFDSGTGGLAVLEVILNLDNFNNETHEFMESGDGRPDFEKEYFIFLADQANMPYGNYSRENNTALLKEHIIKDTQFLLDRKYYLQVQDRHPRFDKDPVKTIVIACNTATAVGKEDVDAFMERAGLEVKVIGIIDAAVEGALDMFAVHEDGTIAVMATAGTVASGGYPGAIEQRKKEKQLKGRILVFQQAGVGLAGAIDGSPEFIDPAADHPRAEYKGPSDKNSELPLRLSILSRYPFNWGDNNMLYNGDKENPTHLQINSVENYIAYHLVSLLENILHSPQPEKLKALLLACTHYPFYREVFRQKLVELRNYRENNTFVYRPVLADTIILIDPSRNAAITLYEHLKNVNIFNNKSLSQSEFYLSVPNIHNPHVQTGPDGGFTYEYKYHRPVGVVQEYVKRVPFTTGNISPDTRHRLREKVPSVYQLILDFHRHNEKLSGLSPDLLFPAN